MSTVLAHFASVKPDHITLCVFNQYGDISCTDWWTTPHQHGSLSEKEEIKNQEQCASPLLTRKQRRIIFGCILIVAFIAWGQLSGMVSIQGGLGVVWVVAGGGNGNLVGGGGGG